MHKPITIAQGTGWTLYSDLGTIKIRFKAAQFRASPEEVVVDLPQNFATELLRQKKAISLAFGEIKRA